MKQRSEGRPGGEPAVGMYVHTHWGYGYPYAARTWRIGDWELFLAALRSAGTTASRSGR